MGGGGERSNVEDLGFKVFKLADTHYAAWSGTPERNMEALRRQMRLIAEDPLRPGWTTPGLLWEIAVKEGFGLNSAMEEVPDAGVAVWRVTDPEKEPAQRFLACFAERLPADIAKRLELTREDLFVVRDSALDDTLASNLALQCRLKTI